MKPNAIPKVPPVVRQTKALRKIPQPCLANLPKTPTARGVTFKHQTPGNPLRLIISHAREPFVDPTHPATKASSSKSSSGSSTGSKNRESAKVQWTSPTDAFRVSAGPKALLIPPDFKKEPAWSEGLMFEKWEDKTRRVREGSTDVSSSRNSKEREASSGKDSSVTTAASAKAEADLKAQGQADMARYATRRKAIASQAQPISLMFANNKGGMGGHVHFAFAAKKRVRNAIKLVLTKGSRVVADPDGTKQIVSDFTEVLKMRGGEGGLVMRDWTYLVHPTIKLYRMPYPELIEEVRAALEYIRDRGTKMEEHWLASASDSAPASRPRQGQRWKSLSQSDGNSNTRGKRNSSPSTPRPQ